MAIFEIESLFFGITCGRFKPLQKLVLTPADGDVALLPKKDSAQEVRLTQIFSGVMPFLFMVFICMGLMYAFPQIVYYLPDLFYGR